jgi:pimeloyl-ACP methyl ester carboxylesterase
MAMVQFNWFAGAADGHALRDWSRNVFTAIGTGIEARRHMFKHIGVIAHQGKGMTAAIRSTFWPYYARLHEPWIVPDGASVTVPTAYAEHPREILTPPRSVAEPFYGNIQRWTRMPAGGHFPALEYPEALAADITAFFQTL